MRRCCIVLIRAFVFVLQDVDNDEDEDEDDDEDNVDGEASGVNDNGNVFIRESILFIFAPQQIVLSISKLYLYCFSLPFFMMIACTACNYTCS